jgi:uncharacterized protein DUF1579
MEPGHEVLHLAGRQAERVYRTAEYKWILGGRFLEERAQCKLFGQQFEWLGLYGYDNVAKKYTAVWVDNFGTDTEIGDGQYDAAGKVFNYSGEHYNPRSRAKERFRWVITIESPDRMRIEMYAGEAGKEKCISEVTGMRVK